MDIRKAAVEIFGKDHTQQSHIRMLAKILNMSQSGVHKYWYRQRKLSGAAEQLLNLRVKQAQEVTAADLVRPHFDGTGRIIPDEAFENESGDTISRRYADMSDAKRKELVDRVKREIAGDDTAMVGFKL